MRVLANAAWILAVAGAVFGAIGIALVWQPFATLPITSAPFLPAGQSVDTFGGFASGFVRTDAAVIPARAWLSAGRAAEMLLWVGLLVGFALIVGSVRDGKGFSLTLPRVAAALSIVVVVCGFAQQVTVQLSAFALSEELFGGDGDRGTAPLAELSVTVNGWPLWASLALAGLAFVLDRAARLQRDAAGLV